MILTKLVEKIVVVPKLKCDTAEEVIITLSDELIKEDLVLPDYKNAILEREKTYPTALPSLPPCVAIPHADFQLVKKTSIAIATLEQPIIFHNMEAVKEEVEVQIVIMLAVAEAHGQIEMLQKVLAIVQDNALRKKILACTTEAEIFTMIEPMFS